MDIDGYIRFDFTPVKRGTSMRYYVLAATIEDMQQFLAQHGFNHELQSTMTFLPIEKYKASQGSHVLQIHRFMSNHRKGVFPVMTCEEFVNHAIETTANDLSDHCIFGEAILRTDIEFLKIIGSMIGKLSHGCVFDYVLADESTMYKTADTDGLIETYAQYKSTIGTPTEDPCSQKILQDLYDAAPDVDNDLGVYPITLEAYVTSFTELMIDCFN